MHGSEKSICFKQVSSSNILNIETQASLMWKLKYTQEICS